MIQSINRKRVFFGFFFCFILLASWTCNVSAQTDKLALTIDAKSAIIMEAETGKILFEQNADYRLPPASVTKVMTILLIYEALEQNRIGWDDVVTISEHASSMGGSQVFLETGEQQTVRDLTKSVVIASANDASVAMAEFVSGSEESFVDLMNRKARELGMENTSYKNACGLDADGHFTSAKDLAIVSRELITKYPQVQQYTTTWMDSIVHKTVRGEEEFGLTNTNKFIKWYNGATGLKTGSTSRALYCLSGTAQRDGMHLISVVLGAPTPTVRFGEVMKMMDYGFANYRSIKGQAVGTIVGEVEIKKGDREKVEAAVQTQISTVVPKGTTTGLQEEIVLYEHLTAPVVAGAKIGEIIYSYNEKEIGRSDLVAVHDVNKASFGDMLEKTFELWTNSGN